MYLTLLCITTLILFPLLGYITSRNKRIHTWKKTWYTLITLAIIHAGSYRLGFSFRGDLLDYTLLSLDYLMICIWICIWNPSHILLRIGRWILMGIPVVGILIGIILLPPLVFVVNNLEPQSIYRYDRDGVRFEVRKYIDGDTTTEYPLYTTDVYRLFGKLPFEYRIQETIETNER